MRVRAPADFKVSSKRVIDYVPMTVNLHLVERRARARTRALSSYMRCARRGAAGPRAPAPREPPKPRPLQRCPPHTRTRAHSFVERCQAALHELIHDATLAGGGGGAGAPARGGAGGRGGGGRGGGGGGGAAHPSAADLLEEDARVADRRRRLGAQQETLRAARRILAAF